MNIDDAKQIIDLFTTHLHLSEESFVDQLKGKFVPSFWGDGLHLKDSFRGRLYCFLNAKESEVFRTEKIKRVALQAMNTLQQDEQAYRQISWDWSFKMRCELLKDRMVQTDSNLSPEFLAFKANRERAVEEQRQVLANHLKKSLLRNHENRPLRRLDLKTFNDLFGAEFNLGIETINYIESFMDQNPNYFQEDYQGRLEVIRQGILLNQKLKSEFFPPQGALTSPQRVVKMQEKAEELSSLVSSLAEGRNVLICSGYGQKIVTYETLLRLLQLLPQSVFEKLFPSTNGLKKEELVLPEPSKFIEDNIHVGIDELRKNISKTVPQLDLTYFNLLFNDDSRDLPPGVRSLLPGFMNTMLKKGVLANWGQLLQLIPPKEIPELFSLLAYNAQLIPGDHAGLPFGAVGDAFNIMGQLPGESLGALLEWLGKNGTDLERILTNIAKLPVQKTTEVLNDQIKHLYQSIKKVVPSFVLQLLGLNSIFSSGSIWLEFKKESDDTYTVLVYSSGPVVHKHPLNGRTGYVEWPMRIGGVKKENLTPDFFSRLLFHDIEPSCNSAATSSVESIFEGVIGSLGGEVILDETTTKSIDQNSEMNWEGVLNICQSPQPSKGALSLKLQLEAFLRLCNHYLKENTLVLTDPEICQVLKKAVIELSGRIEKIKQDTGEEYLNTLLEYPNFIERFKATTIEIDEAVERYHEEVYKNKKALEANPLHLPEGFVLKMREALSKVGVSEEYIRSLKTTICWAMGSEEIGEFIDAFAQTVGPSKPISSMPLQAGPKGWLRYIFATTYYRFVVTALKTVISLAKIQQSQYPPLLIAQGVHTGLTYILPETLYNWYMQVTIMARNKLLELFGKLILRCIFSKEDYAKILSLANSWKKIVHLGVQLISEKQDIEFNQTVSPLVLPNTMTMELSVPLKDALICSQIDSTAAVKNNDAIFKHIQVTNKFENRFPRTLEDLHKPKIEPKTFLNKLKEWFQDYLKIKNRPNCEPEESFIYLLNQMQQLEISGASIKSLWNEIPQEQIEECIQELTNLSINLATDYSNIKIVNLVLNPKDKTVDDFYKQIKYGSVVVTICTNLAIAHVLARRSQHANLQKYSVNGYEIFLWLRSKVATVDSPETRNRLRDVIHYFTGKHSLKLPAEDFIKELQSKSLFHYGFLEESWALTWLKSKGVLSTTAWDNLTEQVPEFRYLHNFIKFPGVRDKILKFALTKDKLLQILEEDSSDELSISLVNNIWDRWKEMKNREILLPPNDPLRGLLNEWFGSSKPPEYYRKLLILNLLDSKLITSEPPEGEDKVKYKTLCSKPYKKNLPGLMKAIESVLYDENISEAEQFDILLAISNYPALKGQFLPQAYLDLRLLTLLSNSLIHKCILFNDFKDIRTLEVQAGQDILVSGKFPCLFIKKKELHSTPKRIFEGGHFNDQIPAKSAYSFEPPSVGLYFHTFSPRLIQNLSNNTRRTQSAIIAQPELIDRDLTENISYSQALEMIFIEPSDRIVRLFDFARSHPELFASHQFLNLFYTVAYEIDNLKSQLKEASQFVRMIGKFFKSSLKHHLSRNNIYTCFWLVSEGLKLFRFCKNIEPKYVMSLQKSLVQLVKNCGKEEKGVCLALQALFYHHNFDLANRNSEIYSALLRAIFAIEGKASDLISKDKFIVGPIINDFKEMLWQWKERLLKELYKDEFRHTILSELLNEHRLQIDSKLFSIDEQDPWKYRYGAWCVDFFEGTIKESEQLVATQIQYIQNWINSLNIVEGKISLVMDSQKRFFDQENQLEVIVEKNAENLNMKITMEFEKRKYILLHSPPANFNNMLEQFLDRPLAGKVSYWIEEPAENVKRLIVKSEGHTVLLSVKTTLRNPQKVVVDGVYSNDKKIVRHDPFTFNAVTGAFKRFCPLSEMRCWVDASSPTRNLNKLVFKPYELAFELDMVNQTPKFVSSAYAGYFIAKNQFHPSLRGFSSYLLLEQENGHKRVLIPSDQLISAGIMRFLQNIGPFSNIAGELVGNFKSHEKASLYVYDIDERGYLVSDDAKALAYLITLYIILKKERELSATMRLLEALGKQGPFDKSVYNILKMIFLIPLNIDGIAKTRQALCALYEENLWLHPAPETSNTEEKEIWSDLIISVFTLIDLSKNCENLTEYQEYLLILSYVRRLFSVIEALVPKYVMKFSEKVGLETIVRLFALPPDLSSRFQKLNDKFGIANSLFAKPIEGVAKTVLSPSAFDPLKILQTIPLFNRGISETEQEDLLVFVNNLISHQFFNESVIKVSALKEAIKPNLNTEVILNAKDLTPEYFISNFLSYWDIAEKRFLPENSEKQSALRRMLFLIKGGWDKQTERLVEYLSLKFEDPNAIAITMRDFQTILTAKNSEDQPNQANKLLEQLFENLKAAAMSSKRWKQIGGVAATSAKLIGKAIIPRLLTLPIAFLLPMRWINIGGKVANALINPSRSNSRIQYISAEVKDYKHLKELDSQIDKQLSGVLNILFAKSPNVRNVDNSKKVGPFNKDETNKAIESKAAQLNESLKHYYDNTSRDLPLWKFNGVECFWPAYQALHEIKKNLDHTIEEEMNCFLSLVNVIKVKKRQSVLSIDDLYRCFIQDDYSLIADDLKKEEKIQIELIIARNLANRSRLQQVERAMNTLQRIVKQFSNLPSEEMFQQLEVLIDILNSRRIYNISQIDAFMARRLLIFEVCTQKMIWQKQFEGLEHLQKEVNAVIELIMASGKTYFLIPTINSLLSGKKTIPCNLWTAELFQTNLRQITKQGLDVYHQTVDVLRFHRTKRLTLDDLNAILMLLNRAVENGESLNMTPEDAQAIRLIFFDRFRTYIHDKNRGSHLQKEWLLKYRQIIRFFRTSIKAIGDEAHKLLDQKRQQLNYPVGPSTIVHKSYYLVMEKCVSLLFLDKQLMKLIKENNLATLSSCESVCRRVAEKMAEYPLFGIDSSDQQKLGEFVDFVMGGKDQIPKWIADSACKKEIFMVKGTLTKLFPLVLSKTVNVDYGFSMHQNNGELARPYQGNTSPIEQASIRNPYEANLKTMFAFLVNGLNVDQSKKLIEFMIQKAVDTCRLSPDKKLEEVIYFKKLSKWLPGHDFINEKNIEALAEILHKHPDEQIRYDSILCYVRIFVRNQIHFWQKNICSDSQSLNSTFASAYYDTGTPYNSGMYPGNLKMLRDPGSIGQALHIINERCPSDGLHTLTQEMPQNVLEEVLDKFFNAEMGFRALNDGGALLKGMKPIEVAKKILEYAKRHRPDIQAIVFFDRRPSAEDPRIFEDILVYSKPGSSHPEPFDRCTVPPEARFAYYDQPHGFGTDIPLGNHPKCVVLLGLGHMLYAMLQQSFRDRSLLKNDVIEREKNNETIHFAMPEYVKQKIVGNGALTLAKIFDYAAKNEALPGPEADYFAYCAKIRNHLTTGLLDKICDPSIPFEAMEAIFRKFEDDVFTTNLETDPEKLWGFIETQAPTEEVLEAFKDSILDKLKGDNLLSDEEKKQIYTNIQSEPLPIMPPTVAAKTHNGKIVGGIDNDLGQEVHHHQIESAQEVEETENEQVNEQDQELHNNTKVLKAAPRFQEWEWPSEFATHEISWIRSSPLSSYFGGWFSGGLLSKIANKASSLQNIPPPIFFLKELLKVSSFPFLQKIESAFDKRIWLSNNFLPTTLKGLSDMPVEICSREQRDLLEVLVHAEQTAGGIEILFVGCLSMHDAAFWRSKLMYRKGNVERPNLKVCLYDVHTRTVVAGDELDLQKDPDFVRIEVQLHYIDGDVEWGKKRRDMMMQWFKSNDAARMIDSFDQIHINRGKKPVVGSDYEVLQNELTKVSEEDLF